MSPLTHHPRPIDEPVGADVETHPREKEEQMDGTTRHGADGSVPVHVTRSLDSHVAGPGSLSPTRARTTEAAPC